LVSRHRNIYKSFETLREALARDQTTVATVHVGQRSESVMFQLEKPIRIVEGLQRAG
jgi:hypothetical protein